MEGTGRKAAQTRRRLLQAARELISAWGYDAVTVDQIVERSGVAKGTFYHYFKSKDAMMAHICQSLYQELQEQCDARQELTALERVYHYIYLWHKAVQAYNIHFARVSLSFSADPERYGQSAGPVSQIDKGIALMERYLSAAVASGELSPQTPVETLAMAVMFSMQGLTLHHCNLSGAFDVMGWHDTFRQVILQPVLAPYLTHR